MKHAARDIDALSTNRALTLRAPATRHAAFAFRQRAHHAIIIFRIQPPTFIYCKFYRPYKIADVIITVLFELIGRHAQATSAIISNRKLFMVSVGLNITPQRQPATPELDNTPRLSFYAFLFSAIIEIADD